ncbi:MAG: GAF domain-containing protein, partial [Candidatus Aminicenantes bacterium]|nr:GAF domain-containing protein [Candidatus Aminicenantes bacterium]
MSEAEPGTVREAPPSRSVRSPGRPLFVLAVLYFLASAAIFLANETAGSRSLPVIVLSLATIALYGGLTAILLARKDVDPGQVRVFALLAVLVTATITLTPFPPGTAPPWVFAFFVFMYMLVFLANPAVIVHMAALIPERHQILARRPRFLPAHYVGFLGLGLAAAALLLASLDRPPAQAAAFGRAVVFVNIVAYFYAGTAALLLLGGAARSAATSRGRRQALLVFAGVLPWTAVQALRLVLPAGLEARLPLDALEKAVIFLVPVTMFIAIIGFRMFGLGLLVRRGLIYGLTLGLPFAALGGIWLAAGAFASRALGIEATPLRVGVILLIVGLLLRPVGRRVTAGIDRIFFPEKIALRRLPRAVTGEMAAAADLDGVAGRLVERIRTELQVQSAALLTADEAGRFFRVRALSRESGPPAAAADVVLKSEDLALRPELLEGRPAARLTSSGSAPGEWGAMLARLEADTLVPVTLGGPPTALISLGRPQAGGYFDGHDLDQLEVLAEQVAAVIEHARVRELAL